MRPGPPPRSLTVRDLLHRCDDVSLMSALDRQLATDSQRGWHARERHLNPAMSQPSVGHAHTVLVVDDEPTILEMLIDVLGDEGFTVQTATDGRQALDRVLTTLPDLILTDLMMPLLDGRALLRSLREQPHTAHIPVLLMSAAGHLRADDTFSGFIAKPFSIETLLAELLRHLT